MDQTDKVLLTQKHKLLSTFDHPLPQSIAHDSCILYLYFYCIFSMKKKTVFIFTVSMIIVSVFILNYTFIEVL